MDKCELFKPDFSFESDIKLFHKEMIDANSSMDVTGPLRRMENIKNGLNLIKDVKMKKVYLKIGLNVNNSFMCVKKIIK